uniref:Uncharacterized protein n=1 Tax=Neospora caninum (strain Liverpool) TaxID=572307 RepID=A0A0F7U4T1_NEOCL|nr:TPA: hypothetical protein BN1204_006500 [Neospora caninum Liverpool]
MEAARHGEALSGSGTLQDGEWGRGGAETLALKPSSATDRQITHESPVHFSVFLSRPFRPTCERTGGKTTCPPSASPTPRETGLSGQSRREGDTSSRTAVDEGRHVSCTRTSPLNLSPACASMGIPSASSYGVPDKRIGREASRAEVSPGNGPAQRQQGPGLSPRAFAAVSALNASADAAGSRPRSAASHGAPSKQARPVSAPAPWAPVGSAAWDSPGKVRFRVPKAGSQKRQGFAQSWRLTNHGTETQKSPPCSPLDMGSQGRRPSSGLRGESHLPEAQQRELHADLRRLLVGKAREDLEGPQHCGRLKPLEEALLLHKLALSRLRPLKSLVKELDATFEMLSLHLQNDPSVLLSLPLSPLSPRPQSGPSRISVQPCSSFPSFASSPTSPSSAASPATSPPDRSAVSTGHEHVPALPLQGLRSPEKHIVPEHGAQLSKPASSSPLQHQREAPGGDPKHSEKTNFLERGPQTDHTHSPRVLAQLQEERLRREERQAKEKEDELQQKCQESLAFLNQLKEKLRRQTEDADPVGAFFAPLRRVREHKNRASAPPSPATFPAPPFAVCSGETGLSPPVLWLKHSLFRLCGDTGGLSRRLETVAVKRSVSLEQSEEHPDKKGRKRDDAEHLKKTGEGEHATKADMERSLRQTQAEIASRLKENHPHDPDIDTVLLNFQELRPDAVAEDFLRDVRLALRHLLSTSRREDVWAVVALETLVKGLVLTLDREIVAHQNYMSQLEHLVVSHRSREAELLSVQMRNQELQCLVDSVKRLKQEEDAKHEQEKHALRHQIQKLVTEIDRLTPNEEVVEKTRDLMTEVENALETHSSECMHQQGLLEGLTKTLSSLVVGKGETVSSLRDKKAGRVVELANGELEFRTCDVQEASASVREEDLGYPDPSTPVKLRWKYLRRLLLKYRAVDQAPLGLPDLLVHIERIYDFKTAQDLAASPASSAAHASPVAGARESKGCPYPRPRLSLVDAWVEFETEEFGLVSQAEKKIVRLLSAINKLIHQAGGATDSLPTEIQLFARFLGFCELSSYYPLPVLSVFLFVRQQCSRWRKEKLNSVSLLLRSRQQRRERSKQVERQQHKLLQEVMKEKRLEIARGKPPLADSRVPPGVSSPMKEEIDNLFGQSLLSRSKPIDRPSSQPSFLSPPTASLQKTSSFSSSSSASSSSSSSSFSSSSLSPFPLDRSSGVEAAAGKSVAGLDAGHQEEREDGEEEDLIPPPHLVSASVGFAAAVEGLRGLPTPRWDCLLEALGTQIVFWSPRSSACPEPAGEQRERPEAHETAGEAGDENAARRLEGRRGFQAEREASASRERKEKLLRVFLREKFVVEFPGALEQKRKEAKLRRKQSAPEEAQVALELSHAEVEMVLARSGLLLSKEVWRSLLDPVSEGSVTFGDCILAPANKGGDSAKLRGLLDDAYLPVTAVLKTVVETYVAQFQESMATPMSRFRAAIAAKGSSIFSRAEFRQVLKTIDAGVSTEASNALFNECQKLRRACTVDSQAASLVSSDFLDFCQDAIPEPVFYAGAFAQGHFFAPSRAATALAPVNLMSVREDIPAPAKKRRRGGKSAGSGPRPVTAGKSRSALARS